MPQPFYFFLKPQKTVAILSHDVILSKSATTLLRKKPHNGTISLSPNG